MGLGKGEEEVLCDKQAIIYLYNNVSNNIIIVLLQYREERFRQTSESTNQRVLWWSLLQTSVLIAMGYWQMRHLKSFFEAKKLV